MSFETDNWQQPDADVTRALPHALGPEKSALSTMLQDPQEFIPLAMEAGLTAKHFYLPSHATLFSFLVGRFQEGKEIELVSLIQALIDTGKIDRVGGPATLADLYTYQPSPGYFRNHISELRNKFSAREILRISRDSSGAVFDSPDEIPETLEKMEREIMAIRDMDVAEKPQSIRDTVQVVADKFQAELRREPGSAGIPTGFEDFDRMTKGLCSPDMIVVGARPSVGKTAFMMNIAERVCVDLGKPALIFSAEMSTESITRRLAFSRARFSPESLTRGHKPDKGELRRIQRSFMEIAASPLHIDDKSGPTISYIAAKARRMRREHGIEFIGIDYLGLIKSLSKQSQYSREREISEISAGVKGIAKDIGIPVLLLAQLNREVEKRGKGDAPGKPRMSDLKDSGAIEADADIIGMLSRDGATACLDLVKNRNGATGQLSLTFIGELFRFETGAPVMDQEPPLQKSRFDD